MEAMDFTWDWQRQAMLPKELDLVFDFEYGDCCTLLIFYLLASWP